MSNVTRRVVRNQGKTTQRQLDELSKLTYETTTALGEAIDGLRLRVVALEQALVAAKAKTNGSGLVVRV